MTSLLLVYGIFNALCVGILVILAHDAPVMDEEHSSERQGDRPALGAALAAEEGAGLRSAAGDYTLPLHGKATA